jgi:glutamate transport system permease protein
MRVLPITGLRLLAAGYVNIIRNSPPVLVFFIVTFGLPALGIRLSFFSYAVIALTIYEASFICEAVRSGMNFVSIGQAEAARSLGMTTPQVLRYVVIPQALANALPPIGNYMIALSKATAISGTFGVTEATIGIKYLAFENPDHLMLLFLVIALGYVAINTTIAMIVRYAENRLAVLT